jgi:hypothetical protein
MLILNLLFVIVLAYVGWMIILSFIDHAVKFVCWITYIKTGVRHGDEPKPKD